MRSPASLLACAMFLPAAHAGEIAPQVTAVCEKLCEGKWVEPDQKSPLTIDFKLDERTGVVMGRIGYDKPDDVATDNTYIIGYDKHEHLFWSFMATKSGGAYLGSAELTDAALLIRNESHGVQATVTFAFVDADTITYTFSMTGDGEPYQGEPSTYKRVRE